MMALLSLTRLPLNVSELLNGVERIPISSKPGTTRAALVRSAAGLGFRIPLFA